MEMETFMYIHIQSNKPVMTDFTIFTLYSSLISSNSLQILPHPNMLQNLI